MFDHFDLKDTPSKKKKSPTQKTLQVKVTVACQEAAIQPVKLEFIPMKIFFLCLTFHSLHILITVKVASFQLDILCTLYLVYFDNELQLP